MSSPSPSRAETGQASASGEARSRQGRLLVWVGNSAYADSLVRHAHQWADAMKVPWTVICVETPGTVLQPIGQRELATRALLLAERLGASTDSVSAQSVLAAVVGRVRQEGATMVMIGGHPPDGWLDEGRRHWLGALADALSAKLPEVTVSVVQYPALPNPARTPDARAWRSISLPWPDALLALAAVGLCTAMAALMEPYFTLGSIAMVYLAGVVYVALHRGQSAALLSVFASIFFFDLVFVPPRWSLKPTEPQYYFEFAVMLIVGVLISRLIAHARLQAQVAASRARRAQALNELARHLVAARSGADIGAGLAAAVKATFAAQAVLLLADKRGKLEPVAGGGPAADDDRGAALAVADVDAAQALFDGGAAGQAADADPMHLLSGAAGALGVLMVKAVPSRVLSPEDRHLLEAFANQAALALERQLFERRSASALVLAETEQLRSTMLSAISHDFRTPLTTIIGSATSLLEQGAALDATHRTRLLRGVVEEAERMHASMSELLDLTRMEEGAVQPNCEWCPADDLIGEAMAVLAPRLAPRTVRVPVPADAVVWCDPRLVEHLLVNLLDNALRHTPPHCAIEVRVELTEAHWRLIVRDDGPGLPAGQEHEVFKKFFRARDEQAGTGTGLGLAICAAVARLHGGTIEAANADGARFTLTLPQPSADWPLLEKAA